MRQPINTLPKHRLGFLRGMGLLLLVAGVFLVYNYRAYGSFFFDDAFDHLTWTKVANLRVFIDGLLTWKFLPNNFRPVAHFYYRLMFDLFGYHFRAWVAVLHIFHLIAIWLLWLVIRRLGAGIWAAAAGTLVFALNMSAFYVYWRPMFHFDLLCGLFIILCLYLYMRGDLLLSLVAFWLAYKSKEIGVAIPAILLAYEWWFGGRRWRRVVPFAVIAASFIVQAYLHNRVAHGGYALHFSADDVWTCIRYYADHALFVPYLGFLLPLLVFFKRDRRVYFGLWFALCTLAPMFLLPARLYDAYLYIPSAGLAIAAAFLARGCPKWALAAFCALWLGANWYVLQQKAPHEMELARHNRHFFDAAFAMARQHPEVHAVTFRNSPPEMAHWGITGVFRLAFPGAKVYWAEDPAAAAVEQDDGVAITVWDFDHDQLIYHITQHGNASGSVVKFNKPDALATLTTGWYGWEGHGFCWSQPKASAALDLPPSAKEFYILFAAVPGQIPRGGALSVWASVGGVPMPALKFTQEGAQKAVWALSAEDFAALSKAAGATHSVPVTLEASPPFRPSNGDTRVLGLAVTEFGFR
jgi:hypothetical protein